MCTLSVLFRFPLPEQVSAFSSRKGFQNLGADTIRFDINPQTTSSSWWNNLVAAYAAAGALGMNVMIAPWTQPGSGRITNMSAFYAMWDTVITKYGGNSRFFFDLLNEPWGYSATELTDLATAWESGLCPTVTGAGTANGTRVQLSTCSGAGNQKWSRR